MGKIVILGLFLFPLLVSLFAIRDILKDNTWNMNKKLLWMVISIMIPLIGAIIYFFFGKSRTLKN
jgi:hypothetical protein